MRNVFTTLPFFHKKTMHIKWHCRTTNQLSWVFFFTNLTSCMTYVNNVNGHKNSDSILNVEMTVLLLFLSMFYASKWSSKTKQKQALINHRKYKNLLFVSPKHGNSTKWELGIEHNHQYLRSTVWRWSGNTP